MLASASTSSATQPLAVTSREVEQAAHRASQSEPSSRSDSSNIVEPCPLPASSSSSTFPARAYNFDKGITVKVPKILFHQVREFHNEHVPPAVLVEHAVEPFVVRQSYVPDSLQQPQPPPSSSTPRVKRQKTSPLKTSGGLWTVAQERAIDTLFLHGWHQDDAPRNFIRDLQCTVYPTKQDLVRSSIDDAMRTERFHSCKFFMATDCNLRDLTRLQLPSDPGEQHRLDAACAAFGHLRFGPALFRTKNVLEDVEESHAMHDHSMLQFSFGTRMSATHAHPARYGADSYVHLVHGEKLWFVAPRQYVDQLWQIMANESAEGGGRAFNISRYCHTQTEKMQKIGVMAIHQRAGDTVFVPGSWVYAVKNVTDTISFSGSYIRPSSEAALLDYLKLQPDSFQHTIDVPAVKKRIKDRKKEHALQQLDHDDPAEE